MSSVPSSYPIVGDLPRDLLIQLAQLLGQRLKKVTANQSQARADLARAAEGLWGGDWCQEKPHHIVVLARNAKNLIQVIADYERSAWEAAQPPPAPPTLEEKVAALEAEVAKLQAQRDQDQAALEAKIKECEVAKERAEFEAAGGVAAHWIQGGL